METLSSGGGCWCWCTRPYLTTPFNFNNFNNFLSYRLSEHSFDYIVLFPFDYAAITYAKDAVPLCCQLPRFNFFISFGFQQSDDVTTLCDIDSPKGDNIFLVYLRHVFQVTVLEAFYN